MKKFYIFAFLVVAVQLTSFASEFTLRVLRDGKHTVSLHNQTQSNNVNYFRFYGLTGNSFLLTVKDQFTDEVIFNNYVQIQDGANVQAELDQNKNLIIKSNNAPSNEYNSTVGTVSYSNSNSSYYQNSMNNMSSNNMSCGYQGCTHHGNNPHTHQHNGNNNWGAQNNWNNNCNNNWNNSGYFDQFINTLKNENFDSERLKSAKNYAAANMLSASQINAIAETFTFDSNRLSWAKAAYHRCYDRQNYFLLKNSFDFNSNYEELLDYTANH